MPPVPSGQGAGGETGEPAIPEDQGDDGTPPAWCPRRPVGIEEAASKHLSTIQVSGHRENQGPEWKPRATPLNFLQMVTTKDPRPKRARVVVDCKLTLSKARSRRPCPVAQEGQLAPLASFSCESDVFVASVKLKGLEGSHNTTRPTISCRH